MGSPTEQPIAIGVGGGRLFIVGRPSLDTLTIESHADGTNLVSFWPALTRRDASSYFPGLFGDNVSRLRGGKSGDHDLVIFSLVGFGRFFNLCIRCVVYA
jgi:hypothetical protein